MACPTADLQLEWREIQKERETALEGGAVEGGKFTLFTLNLAVTRLSSETPLLCVLYHSHPSTL